MSCRHLQSLSVALLLLSPVVLAVVTAQSSGSCGRTLIAYGNDDRRVHSPWTALLFRKTSKTQGVFLPWMSGVILGSRTVLIRGRQFWEAGKRTPRMHGFKSDNLLVGVGIQDRNSFYLDGIAQILEVESVRPHPKSYMEHSEYDFAIVQLRENIKFSSKVNRICVEAANDATFTAPYDSGSKFFTAAKKLSGYMSLSDNSTVLAIPYKLRAADVCDPRCQSQAPQSSEAQLESETQAIYSIGDVPGEIFLPGAAVASWYMNKWYLAGIVTKSYGCNEQFKHFISPVAASVNLRWINANVQLGRLGPQKYSCLDGTPIDASLVCNGRIDCKDDGGSDEHAEFCEALNCPPQSLNADSCTISSEFESDKFHVIRNGTKSLLRVSRPTSSPPVAVSPRPSKRPQAQTPRPTTISTTTRAPRPSTTPPAPLLPPTTARQTTIRTTSTPTAPSFAFPTTSITPVAGGPKCPPLQLTDREKEGLKFRCTDHSKNSIPEEECLNSPQSAGTKVLQSCLLHYKSVSRTSSSEMTCGPDGVWKRGRYLACIAECGVPKVSLTGHIVNGTSALPSNWPWNAALFRRIRDEFKYICGATLITSSAIITAAHCLDGVPTSDKDAFRVVLAPISSKWTINANHVHSQIMEVAQLHMHEQYNSATFEADIAVVRLKKLVRINSHVYPACFPFPGRENEQIERFQTSPGNIGVVAGFGTDETFKISETLKEVRLPVVSVRDCFRVLDVFPTTTQLCAGYTTGISVCNGDSGAGLLFQEEGARKLFYLQGIVSHGQSGKGSRFCDYNRYSIFTKVGPFKEWVEQIASSDLSD